MKVKEISANCKISVDVKGNWYTYQYGEVWELSKEDDVKKMRKNLWDEVISEVETQIQMTYKNYINEE